ncbi:PH domain-containing protein [Prauserella cavernicola]|uniref:PH domain-containing protein n=1 Tax=Prauserella cavernicola TaxID=2800127 RepID=A0A934QYH0_9PSEU|nr:PH domain-containing protein [Prauserella cavernicola]MBK1787849.1 PH domain-containing protein [Prauserella cavernicola]
MSAHVPAPPVPGPDTDTDTTEPPDAEVTWQRLHSRVIWVDAVKLVVSLIPTLIATLVFDVPFTPWNIWPVAIVTAIGIIGSVKDALRWIKTRYRITEHSVERRTGLLVRKVRTVPRDRIRSVDASAKLRHRLSGLRVVTVGTGQNATTGEAPLHLDALSKAGAEQLRVELLGHRATADEGSEHVIATLRRSWVFYNLFNAWAFFAAALLLWSAYWGGQTVNIDVKSVITNLTDWDSLGLLWTIVIGVSLWGVVGVIMLAIFFFSENWNFRLTRVSTERGSVLRTTQGLLKTREVHREDKRLRGIEISEPLLWRWMGAADTMVISTGLGRLQGGEPPSVILPRGPVRFAREVAVDVLDDGVRPLEAPLRRHPGNALRRRLGRALLVAAVPAGVLAWLHATTGLVPGWAWLLGPALLPIAVPLAVVAYRALGHTIVGRYLVTRRGLMSRSTAALQTRATVGLKFRQSIFQRRLGLITVVATTAAGDGGYKVVDVRDVDGAPLAGTIAPQLVRPYLDSRERG